MKLKAVGTGLLAALNPVIAHSDEPEVVDHMYSGTGHMFVDAMGCGLWGMGWYGLLFGLAFWTLVILGIVYLFQQVSGQRESDGAE